MKFATLKRMPDKWEVTLSLRIGAAGQVAVLMERNW